MVGSAAYAEEEVRIAIGEGRTTVELSGDDLSIFDPATGHRLAHGAGATTVKVVVEGERVRIGDGSESLVFDGDTRSATRILVETPEGTRVDGRLFLGRILVRKWQKGLHVINRLPMETYLLGIVGSEMSPLWPLEALKAQAVAARTYAFERRMMMRAAGRPYDLESSVLSQVYAGADRIQPSVVEAVKQTRGEVLAFRHRPAEALFHSTCGGTTVPAREAFSHAVPYLVSRKCEFCRPSPRYSWVARFTLDHVARSLRAAGILKGKLKSIERKAGEKDVRINGSARVSPGKIRRAVGYVAVFSDRYVVKTSKQTVTFEGRGFGHGVGLCQWGAKGMAESGSTHVQVLEHYYPGAAVRRIY